MVHTTSEQDLAAQKIQSHPPILDIEKLGIISRDYRTRFPNGYRDFSFTLPQALKILDKNACDAAIFSLYSLVPRQDFNIREVLRPLRHVRAVFLEEFKDRGKREPKRFVLYYRSENRWREYSLHQKFGRLSDKSADFIKDFVADEMPRRLLGNCCVLLCGESNGVKYSRERKTIEDPFGLKASIPAKATVILNPVHDRMTRFEMNLKRKFLSKHGRWVVSVWNKGKTDKRGKTKNGHHPAWAIFHNGIAQTIEPIPNKLCLEVGLLNLKPQKLK